MLCRSFLAVFGELVDGFMVGDGQVAGHQTSGQQQGPGQCLTELVTAAAAQPHPPGLLDVVLQGRGCGLWLGRVATRVVLCEREQLG